MLRDPVARVGVVGIDIGMGAIIGLLVVGPVVAMILRLVVPSIRWVGVSGICHWLVVAVARLWPLVVVVLLVVVGWLVVVVVKLVVVVVGCQGSGSCSKTSNA